MTNRKLVVTLAIGEQFQKMAELTHPLLRLYAERCGADFLSINEAKLGKKLGLVTYEKFQIFDFLNGDYDQVLFIDTYIVVTPNAPSVFELCPANVFGAANESGYSMSEKHKVITQAQLGQVTWKHPYFNSGVMLLGPEHRKVFDPEGELLQQWTQNEKNSDHVMSDQPIINYLVNFYGFEFLDLGKNFNRTRVHNDTHNRFQSYFIHYAGPSGHRYGSRLKQIGLDAKVAENSFIFWLSRCFPAYRKVADRLDIDFFKYLLSKKILR